MNQEELGRTGVHLPEVGLGTSSYTGGMDPLRKGIELGASFFESAGNYHSEETVREAAHGTRGS
jgi:aryl-alcohol dehydrogenase-like predicted oxidoreductase